MDEHVATVRFIDGVRRAAYEGTDGCQYVIDGDGVKVFTAFGSSRRTIRCQRSSSSAASSVQARQFRCRRAGQVRAWDRPDCMSETGGKNAGSVRTDTGTSWASAARCRCSSA
jgi:hypothetical protein